MFNAFTADIATGLTTCITKDAQTTATGLIPFAQGITVAGVGITEPPRAAAYQWVGWNPTDVAGTLTNASSSATLTQTATNYMTMANASGTVTFTFTKAGNYLVTARTYTAAVAAIDAGSYNQIVIGGTATRLLSLTTYTQAMDISPANYGANIEVTSLISATASQTVTLLPKVALVRAAGTASNYPTYAEASAVYTGT